MADDDLKMIREARMKELQQQGGGGGGSPGGGQDRESQKERDAQQRKAIISQILQREAEERLERIRLVNDKRATDVENRLIMLARSGQLRGQVTEEQLKQLLGSLSEQQEQEKIVVTTKTRRWDDDDDLDDLLKD